MMMIRLILMTRRRRRRRRRLALLLLLLLLLLAHPPQKKKGNHHRLQQKRLSLSLSLSLSSFGAQQKRAARSDEECRSRVKIRSGKIGRKKKQKSNVKSRHTARGVSRTLSRVILLLQRRRDIACPPREESPLSLPTMMRQRRRNHQKKKKKIVTRSRCSVVSRISGWICRRNRWLQTRFGIINAILSASSPSRLSSRQSSSR